jgi:hypothetical protein
MILAMDGEQIAPFFPPLSLLAIRNACVRKLSSLLIVTAAPVFECMR